MASSRDPGYWMAESGVARRTGGGDGGRALVVGRFDCGPRRVGHPRNVHIDVGTNNGIDTDADLDTGFDANTDSDRDAATGTGTDGGGATCGERPVPVPLGEHQLHDVRVRRPKRRPL